MSNQPLLMQGEELIFQFVASFSEGKMFRDGDLFLTNQRLIWKKSNSLKAGFKGGLIMGIISASGQNSYSIPLNTIQAIGPWKKNGIEFLTTEGKTYKMNLSESTSILGAAGVGTLKNSEDKRNAVIAHIQSAMENNKQRWFYDLS